MTDLGIVIVNWNTKDYLKKCLDTVTASQGDFTFQVVVADNASTDGSQQMVREYFPDVKLIASEINGGFSFGNNLGLRALGYCDKDDVLPFAPRYLMLLNPDTEVPPDAFYQMVQYMDAHPEVGVMGPKLLLPDGTLDLACRRGYPTPEVAFYHFSKLSKLFPNSPRFARYNMTYLDIDTEAEVDSVVGACMLLRREAIEQVGLMDETFFMYGEDIDWAYRIKQVGWQVVYYPKVIIWHIKRAASRRSPKARLEFYRAMLIFYRKHYQQTTPLWLHSLILMALLLGTPLRNELLPSPKALTPQAPTAD